MPELPDVEIFRRYLDATSLHKRIRHVHVEDGAILENVSRQRLAAALVGHELRSTRRHGKCLGASITGNSGWLILHFGMTGYLEAFGEGREPSEHTKVLVEFAGGRHLAYVNMRKLGLVTVVDEMDGLIESRGLGPDALDVDLPAFREMLAGRSGAVKPLLMNQGVIAGIGNVYSDEMLFHARIRPDRKAGALPDSEAATLHRQMLRVLKKAIECKADPQRVPSSWILPRRENGGRCPRCNGPLTDRVVSGRRAWFCTRCQR